MAAVLGGRAGVFGWRWAEQQKEDMVGNTAKQSFPEIGDEVHFAEIQKYWGDKDLEENLKSCLSKPESET